MFNKSALEKQEMINYFIEVNSLFKSNLIVVEYVCFAEFNFK